MFLEVVVVMDGSKGGSSYSCSFRTFNYGSHFPCGIDYDIILINYLLDNTVIPSIPFHTSTPIYSKKYRNTY